MRKRQANGSFLWQAAGAPPQRRSPRDAADPAASRHFQPLPPRQAECAPQRSPAACRRKTTLLSNRSAAASLLSRSLRCMQHPNTGVRGVFGARRLQRGKAAVCGNTVHRVHSRRQHGMWPRLNMPRCDNSPRQRLRRMRNGGAMSWGIRLRE
jgi:hypothetical protein